MRPSGLPLACLERQPGPLAHLHGVASIKRREEGWVGRVDGYAEQQNGAALGDGEAAVVVLACNLLASRPEAAVGGQREGKRRGEDRQDCRQPVLELLAADAGAGAVHGRAVLFGAAEECYVFPTPLEGSSETQGPEAF